MPANAKASSQQNKSHKTGKHAAKGQRHKQKESKGVRRRGTARRRCGLQGSTVGPMPLLPRASGDLMWHGGYSDAASP